MKAIVYSAPFQFTYTQVPTPQPSVGEVLVRVRMCGICGTDLHIHQGEFISEFPLILGMRSPERLLSLEKGLRILTGRPGRRGQHGIMWGMLLLPARPAALL